MGNGGVGISLYDNIYRGYSPVGKNTINLLVLQSDYLAGAWSKPGHGYGAVIPSGLECFAEIVKSW